MASRTHGVYPGVQDCTCDLCRAARRDYQRARRRRIHGPTRLDIARQERDEARAGWARAWRLIGHLTTPTN